jgi:hypothetical protein
MCIMFTRKSREILGKKCSSYAIAKAFVRVSYVPFMKNEGFVLYLWPLPVHAFIYLKACCFRKEERVVRETIRWVRENPG